MSFFDQIQISAFNLVTDTFGDMATWVPYAGGDMMTGKVLYKDAFAKEGVSNVDYSLERYQMEYKQGDFPGLKDSVDNSIVEQITINTISGPVLFNIRRCETKYDGKTIVATLNPA